MSWYLGIDSGTQSTKAVLLNGDFDVVGRGSAPHAMIDGLGVGHKEQDPAQWVEALSSVIAQATKQAGISPADIDAIGISGQQHGFVPLDKLGNVIRPAKLWCDTATALEASEIEQKAGGPSGMAELTGNSLPAGFTASKIEWMRRHEPENYARLETVLLPHDYLNFRLTGERRMEFGDASGTGLMDVRRRCWSDKAIALIDTDLKKALPDIHHSMEPCGRVSPSAAREFGLSTECLVSAGGGDNMMGAIGTGNVSAGVVTASLGTSGTIYAFSEHPVIDTEAGEIAAFCDSTGGWLPLLCTMNVTVATELAKQTFCIDTADLNLQAAKSPPGADGLMLLPYFEGERVPNIPDGTGVWFGYSAKTHGISHFCRAAMEGPALGLCYGYRRMERLGVRASEVRLTGGGSKNAVWGQIIADCFGVPVVCTKEAEGAALGAAIQAAWCLAIERGMAVSIQDLCRRAVILDESTRVLPDRSATDVYRELQNIHDTLSGALRKAFGMHRRFLDQRGGSTN